MSLCLSGTSKNFGAWGSNRSWDIDLLLPPCIFSTWHGFWVPVVCPNVCQHLPGGLKMFLCVSVTFKKFGVWGPNGSSDIDLCFPTCIFLNSAQVLGTVTLPMGLSTCPKWSRNIPMCFRNLKNKFGVWGPNRGSDIDLSPIPCIFSI